MSYKSNTNLRSASYSTGSSWHQPRKLHPKESVAQSFKNTEMLKSALDRKYRPWESITEMSMTQDHKRLAEAKQHLATDRAFEAQEGHRYSSYSDPKNKPPVGGRVNDTSSKLYSYGSRVASKAVTSSMSGGQTLYNYLGGVNRPSGKKYGLSQPTESDNSAAFGAAVIPTIIDTALMVGGMLMEGDDSTVLAKPDSALIVEAPVIAAETMNVAPATSAPYDWKFSTMAGRKYYLTKIAWPSTISGMSRMLSFPVATTFMSNQLLKNAILNHRYFNFSSITYTLTYETNIFYAGIGRMVYLPGWAWFQGTQPDSNAISMGLRTARGVEFFANEMVQVSFTVPWTYNKDWYESDMLTSADVGSLGYVIIGVVSPLIVPTGGSELSLQLSVELNDLKLAVPCVPLKTIKVKTGLQNVTSGDFVMQGDKKEDLASIFYYPTTSRHNGFYNTCKMISKEPISQTSFLSSGSEMSINSLCSTYGWTNTFQWPIGANTGEILHDFMVEPYNTTHEQGWTQESFSTPIRFFSAFASHWSGSMVYKFLLAKNGFTKGKLIFVCSDTLTPINALNMTLYPHIIFDIADTQVIEIRAANMSPHKIRPLSHRLEFADIDISSCFKMSVVVYSPLVTTSGGLQSVELTQWERGMESGPNQYRIYTPNYLSNYDRKRDIFRRLEDLRMEGDSGDLPVLGEDICPPGPISGFEEITTILELMKKAQPFESTKIVRDPWASLAPLQMGPFPVSSIGDVTTYLHSYNKYFSPCFAFWGGDVNVMMDANTDVLCAREVPINGETNWKFGSGPGMIRLDSVATNMTFSISPMTWNNFLMSPGLQTAKWDSSIYQTRLYLDAYDSKTLNPASKTAGYWSSAENFWYGGYTCIPHSYHIQKILNQEYDDTVLVKKPIESNATIPSKPVKPPVEQITVDPGSLIKPQDSDDDEIETKIQTSTATTHSLNSREVREPVIESIQSVIPDPPMTLHDRYESFRQKLRSSNMRMEGDSDCRDPEMMDLYIKKIFQKIASAISWFISHYEEKRSIIGKVWNDWNDIYQQRLTILKTKARTLRNLYDLKDDDEVEFEQPTCAEMAYVAMKDVVDIMGRLNGMLNSWRDEHRGEAIALSVAVTNSRKDLRQIKDTLKRIHLIEMEQEIAESVFQMEGDVYDEYAARQRQRYQSTRPGFFSSIYNIPRDVAQITSNLASTSAAVGNSVERTAMNVEVASNSVLGSMTNVLMENLGISKAMISTALILMIDLGETLCSGTLNKWASFGVKLAIAIGLNTNIMSRIVSYVHEISRVPHQLAEGLEMQGDTSVSGVATVLTIAVMAIGAKAIGGFQTDRTKIKSIWEFCAVRGRETFNIKTGLATIMESFETMHSFVMEALLKYVFPESEEVSKMRVEQENYKALEQCAKTINELSSLENLPLLTYDMGVRDKFEKLHVDMRNLKMKGISADYKFGNKVNTLSRQFEELCSAAVDNALKIDIRVDPFHISLGGDPGVGKSFVSYAIMNAISDSQKWPILNRIYPRTEGMDFYDNYSGQRCFYVDDMDMINNEESAAAHIQRKSNVPVILNMADLKKKGMYFMSKVMMSTTNTLYPRPAGIAVNSAYLRRRDVLIEANWASESRVKKTDFSHLVFTIRDPLLNTNANFTNAMTYPQLVAYLIGRYSHFAIEQTRLIKGMNPSIPIETIYRYNIPPYTVPRCVQDILDDQITRRLIGIEEVMDNVIEVQGAAQSSTALYENRSENLIMMSFSQIGMCVRDDVVYGIVVQDGIEYLFEENDVIVTEIKKALVEMYSTDELEQMYNIVHGDRVSDFRIWRGQMLRFIRSNSWKQIIEKSGHNSVMMLTDFFISDPERRAFVGTPRRAYRVSRYIHETLDRFEGLIRGMQTDLSDFQIFVLEAQMLQYRIFYACTTSSLYLTNHILGVILKLERKIFEFISSNWKWIKWVVAAIVCGYIMWQMTNTTKEKSINIIEGDTMRIQTHEHLDLPDDGIAYNHIHLCDKCNNAFMHIHKRHSLEISKQYLHLCHRCRLKKRNNAINAVHGGSDLLQIFPDEQEPDELIDVEFVALEGTIKVGNKSIIEGIRAKKHVDFDLLEQNCLIESSYPKESGKRLPKRLVHAETSYPKESGKRPPKPMVHAEAVNIPVKSTEEPVALSDAMRIEGTNDENAMNLLRSIKMNSGLISFGGMTMNYLGLKGLKVLVPAHLFMNAPNRTEYLIGITRFGKNFSGFIPHSAVKRPSKVNSSQDGTLILRDMMILDLTSMPQVPTFADLTHHIPLERDLEMANGRPICFGTHDTRDGMYEVHFSQTSKMLTGLLNYGKSENFEIYRGISYPVPTKVGYCGAAIISVNPHMPKKILGIHVAGHRQENLGVSILIWKELIDSFIGSDTTANGPPVDYMIMQCDTEAKTPKLLPMGRHLILGVLDEGINTPLKSDILMSPIFDAAYPHTSEPAIFLKGDPRQTQNTEYGPLEMAMQKYNQETGLWKLKHRVMSKNHLLKQFIEATDLYPGPKRLLTVDEAINGIPGILDKLNMRTSPGYPYVNERPSGTIGKMFLFDEIGEIDGSPQYRMKSELEKDVNEILRTVKMEGWCKFNYYVDWMKDEKRPIRSIRKAKTRLFNVHSVAWLIVNRIYFGAAAAAFIWAKLKVGSGLGLDMFGPDVTALVNFLGEVGNMHWDSDVEKWDGGFDCETCMDGIWILTMWTLKHQKDYVFIDGIVVGSSFMWRIHICGRLLYVPFLGMPSGHFLTAVLNTLGHNHRKYLVWCESAEENEETKMYNTPTKADEHIREVKVGDDTVGTVTQFASSFYNPLKVQEIYEKHGISCVPPTKDECEFGLFKNITKVQFLKCSFIRDLDFSHLWHAKMNLDTVRELTNWIRKGHPPMELLKSNLEDFEHFLHGHGREIYEREIKIVQMVLDERQIPIYMNNFDQLQNSWEMAHNI